MKFIKIDLEIVYTTYYITYNNNKMDHVIDDESSVVSSLDSSISSSISDRGLLIDNMSVDDLIEVENEIFKSIECFLAVDILQISNPNYYEKFHTTITDTMYETIAAIYDIEVYEDPYTEIEDFKIGN